MDPYLRIFRIVTYLSLWLLLGGCIQQRTTSTTPIPIVPEAEAATTGETAGPSTRATPVAAADTLTTSTAAATLLPSPTPTRRPSTATAEPTTTAEPTSTAEPTTTAQPTSTPQPTATMPPTATATPELILPEWLVYLNRFRTMAGVAPITELAALTLGSRLHSQYMAINDDPIAHWQDQSNALYDPAGDTAARNGNIFATNQNTANFIWSINFWASAPFHLIPMLAPNLERVGYGDHIDPAGDVNMAAVLDVRSQRNAGNGSAIYPIMFPGNGSRTWIVRHSMNEWPDPLTSCPGYARPAGAPLLLQLGDGSLSPRVGHHTLLMNGVALESCIFDEMTYHNPDIYAEETGRKILDEQDAIVIIPRHPLPIEQLYTVQVEVNGQLYFWEFTTQRAPDP